MVGLTRTGGAALASPLPSPAHGFAKISTSPAGSAAVASV